MVWFKVDDNLAFHSKTLLAGNAAMGLWVRAGSWSAQQLTEGRVPSHMIEALGTRAQAQALVRSGLWVATEDGYQFWQWSEEGRQPSKASVIAEREAARDRQRKARERAAESRRDKPVTDGVTEPDVTVPPTRPDPTRPSYGSDQEEGGVGRHASEPPRMFCDKHPDGTKERCGPCGDQRRIHDAWLRQSKDPPPPRQVKHIPGLCDAHRQREGECEMCERESREVAEVIYGQFGAVSA